MCQVNWILDIWEIMNLDFLPDTIFKSSYELDHRSQCVKANNNQVSRRKPKRISSSPWDRYKFLKQNIKLIDYNKLQISIHEDIIKEKRQATDCKNILTLSKSGRKYK